MPLLGGQKVKRAFLTGVPLASIGSRGLNGWNAARQRDLNAFLIEAWKVDRNLYFLFDLLTSI